MQARYSGKCAVTGRTYPVGAEISKTAHGWAISDTVTEQALAAMETADINLAGGSGYFCDGWTVGETYRADWYANGEKQSGLVTIVAAGSTYYSEDGMSFGVGEERGRRYWAKARLATDEEAAPVLVAESEAQAAEDARNARHTAEWDLKGMLGGGQRLPALPQGWVERCWVTEDEYPARGSLYSLTTDAYLYLDGTVVVQTYDADAAHSTYTLVAGDTTADLARIAAHKITRPNK